MNNEIRDVSNSKDKNEKVGGISSKLKLVIAIAAVLVLCAAGGFFLGFRFSQKTVQVKTDAPMEESAEIESVDEQEQDNLWIGEQSTENENETITVQNQEDPADQGAAAELIPDVAVGDYVFLGTYPQTRKGYDETPIEWLVLAVEDNKALLISRYALDCQKFNEKQKGVTWETSTIRSWLNVEFLNRAFDTGEQEAILTTQVTADRNPKYYDTDPGNDTEDKVFLLSILEANRYFTSDESRMCAPTDYAIAHSAWYCIYYRDGIGHFAFTVDGRGTGWWWLRSPVSSNLRVAMVNANGSTDKGYPVSAGKGSVRPAIWVDLESGIF